MLENYETLMCTGNSNTKILMQKKNILTSLVLDCWMSGVGSIFMLPVILSIQLLKLLGGFSFGSLKFSKSHIEVSNVFCQKISSSFHLPWFADHLGFEFWHWHCNASFKLVKRQEVEVVIKISCYIFRLVRQPFAWVPTMEINTN